MSLIVLEISPNEISKNIRLGKVVPVLIWPLDLSPVHKTEKTHGLRATVKLRGSLVLLRNGDQAPPVLVGRHHLFLR